MALKTCITNYSFHRSLRSGLMSIEGFLDFCGKAGFDGVDLMAYFWKDKDAEMARLPEWLERNDLELVGYGVGNNFLSHDEQELEKAKAVVRTGIEDARRIGARMMRVFGGAGLDGWTTGSALQRIVACFKEMSTVAADNDVLLTIENHGGVPGTPEEVIACIEEVGSPNFASLFDTGNFLSSGVNPTEAARKLVSYVRHVHVKDARKFPAGSPQGNKAERADYNLEFCTVGQGVVPNGEVFKVLAKGGYDGYVSLEAEGPDSEDEGQRVLTGLANMRKWIKAIR